MKPPEVTSLPKPIPVFSSLSETDSRECILNVAYIFSRLLPRLAYLGHVVVAVLDRVMQRRPSEGVLRVDVRCGKRLAILQHEGRRVGVEVGVLGVRLLV